MINSPNFEPTWQRGYEKARFNGKKQSLTALKTPPRHLWAYSLEKISEKCWSGSLRTDQGSQRAVSEKAEQAKVQGTGLRRQVAPSSQQPPFPLTPSDKKPLSEEQTRPFKPKPIRFPAQDRVDTTRFPALSEDPKPLSEENPTTGVSNRKHSGVQNRKHSG